MKDSRFIGFLAIFLFVAWMVFFGGLEVGTNLFGQISDIFH